MNNSGQHKRCFLFFGQEVSRRPGVSRASLMAAAGRAVNPLLPILTIVTIVTVAMFALALSGDNQESTGNGYDLSWYTIDGGGGTFSSGDGYQLGGTIGQPDASAPMAGEGFTLIGGFWPGVTAPGDQLVLVSAASRRHHAPGVFDLNAPLAGTPVTEPRMNGTAPQMVLTFSATPSAIDSSIDCGEEVVVSHGTCLGTSVSGNDLIVDMTFDNNACVAVTLSHLDDLIGDTDVQVLVRQGNVNGDNAVNVIDLQEVKNHVFQQVDAMNFIYDVDVSGHQLSVVDLQETKNNLFTSASCE